MQTTDQAGDGPRSSEGLGPLPKEECLWGEDSVYGYSAEAMEAERQRCYALGVAAERERWATAARLVAEATPEQLPMALDALADVLRA